MFQPHAAPETWKTITLAPGETPATVRLPVGPVLVPLAVWQARRFELFHREHEHGWPLGLWLSEADDLEAIRRDLSDLSLIVLHNASARSPVTHQVRRLREEFGYRAALRVSDAPDSLIERSIAA